MYRDLNDRIVKHYAERHHRIHGSRVVLGENAEIEKVLDKAKNQILWYT